MNVTPKTLTSWQNYHPQGAKLWKGSKLLFWVYFFSNFSCYWICFPYSKNKWDCYFGFTFFLILVVIESVFCYWICFLLCCSCEEIRSTNVQQQSYSKVKVDSTQVEEHSKVSIHQKIDHKSLLHSYAL